jgi:hypothetical protein
VCAVSPAGAAQATALEFVARLRLPKEAPVTAHLQSLPDGGVEMVLTSAATVSLESFSHDLSVTVLTDHWRDAQGDCALVRVLNGSAATDLPFGVVEHALGDAFFSGDAWALSVSRDALTLLVIDGLGHGPLAQIAAVAGVEAMRSMVPVSPSEDLRAVHAAMHGTVGAAAGIARIGAGSKMVDFGGIGNIEATLVTDGGRSGLVSYPGVVGQRYPTFRTYRHVLDGKSHLVMHTDGLRSGWSPAHYPGLFSRHPALIAGVLFRDCWRQSDDALIFVTEVASDVHEALAEALP